MQVSAENVHTTKERLSQTVKQLGVDYWQSLCRVGVPATDAASIAAAIAKYDIVGRRPSGEQRSLIMRYSSLVCRAQLWRRQML